MKTVRDLSSEKFGRLTALFEFGKSKTPNGTTVVFWLCRCACGNLVKTRGSNLRSGLSRSCGCLRAEVEKSSAKTHGQTRSPEYQSWRGMLDRCRNSKHVSFHRYGGRGISVCKRWLKFENFLADMGKRPAGLSLDRINNDGNYEPSNCRWATDAEQRANKSKKTHGDRSNHRAAQ